MAEKGPPNQPEHGEIPFILLYATILAKLSYKTDRKFLQYYNCIFNQDEIIPGLLTLALDNANINDLFSDETVFFGLGSNSTTIFDEIPCYIANGKKYIDFLKLEIPHKVNVIIDADSDKSQTKYDQLKLDLFAKVASPEFANANNVKLISLATSNYSGIYIIADKRTPHMIWVCFRGTYSSRSAGNYMNSESLWPAKPCSVITGSVPNSESYMKGMFNIIANKIYTIIQAMTFLAKDFLNAKTPESIKVCTTGHSLGGALSTMFAYIFLNAMRTFAESKYKPELYNVFIPKAVCVSLASPRCMDAVVSRRFCYEVATGNIMYKRIVNRGDPIPAMPPRALYYSHPCTDDSTLSIKTESLVYLECNDLLRKFTRVPGIIHYPQYDQSLGCIPHHSPKPRLYNIMSHILYLYIIFQGRRYDEVLYTIFSAEDRDIANNNLNKPMCRIGISTNTETKYCFYDLELSQKKTELGKAFQLDNNITYDFFTTKLVTEPESTLLDYSYDIIELYRSGAPTKYRTGKSAKLNYLSASSTFKPDAELDMPNIICVPDSRYAHFDKIAFIQL